MDGQEDLLGVLHQQVLELLLNLELRRHSLLHQNGDQSTLTWSTPLLPPPTLCYLPDPHYPENSPIVWTTLASSLPSQSPKYARPPSDAGPADTDSQGPREGQDGAQKEGQACGGELADRPLGLDVFECEDGRTQFLPRGRDQAPSAWLWGVGDGECCSRECCCKR